MSFNFFENRILGRGSFGTVYYAKLDYQPVAAKTCFSISSLLREAHLLELCDHTNVVKCKDVVVFRKEPYLITELAEAGNLQENLGKNSFPLHAKNRLLRQICRGLEHIHDRDIVHRDIKATNLLLKNVMQPHLVIADFGSAHIAIESHDSPVYRLHLFKDDIYDAGLVALQIFEDRNDFSKITSFEDMPESGLSKYIFTEERWRRVIMDSLNENPELRPTAAEFRKALRD